MKINRWSCKCKLCKKSWTSDQSDPVKAFAGHSCEKWAYRLAARMAWFKSTLDSETYQMICMFGSHRQVEGHYNAAIKCDGRCMGATGHKCDCSCGGKNHGIGAAA